MTNKKKGDLGEDIVAAAFAAAGIAIKRTAASGATFRDGDLRLQSKVDASDLVIDVKNYEVHNKTLLAQLEKVEHQAAEMIDMGCIVDFMNNTPYIHMRLEFFIDILREYMEEQ